MKSRYLLLVLTACASSTSTLPPVRFANAPAVQVVNDRLDVPKVPATRAYKRLLSNFDGMFFRRVTWLLELHRSQRARGTNALDEVPSSTWFTNRIGVRAMSPAEIADGPAAVGSPEPHRPWTIVSTKVGGASVGFIIKDARGEKWLLKFDPLGFPEAETATHVIAGRLIWAFGYNITEDYVVHLRKDDLVLAPDAVIKDVFGNKSPLDQAELDKRLGMIQIDGDGQIRALVSHWLSGKTLGGHPSEGVRSDDPNDRIPHELRRDLRGMHSLFSWLDHSDIHEGNFLDVWVTDPADRDRHYVKHYLIDFGIALGFAARKNAEPRFGYEYYVDFAAIARSWFTFGMAAREWEDRRDPHRTGLGMYETDAYDPGRWKPLSPNYMPLYLADRIDKFWGAKILIRFTREQIRAAVDAGKLSDPSSADALTETLITRQRATARYWFEHVNPLDEFAVDNERLCFKDLAIVHAFAPAATSRYVMTMHDRTGRTTRTVHVDAADAGVTCAPIELASGRDDYTIVRVTTERPAFAGSTDVHVARDAAGTTRVIGIWRP